MSGASGNPAWIVAAAATLIVLAVVVVRGVALGYPRARLSTRVLSAKEQAIVSACADALFPPAGPIPVSGTEAGLVGYVDGYLARAPRTARLLIRLLFRFVEHGPWIWGPRRVRFTRMRPHERRVALEGMARSSIYFRRVAFVSLRIMLTMGYFAHGAVLRAIGIPDARAESKASGAGGGFAPGLGSAEARV